MRGHYDHEEAMKAIADNVKESAYKIIKRKKATYYGIAMSVKRICEVILKDEKAILPVSTMMHGAHGIEDIVSVSYTHLLHREALIATAVVLFVFILMINLCFAVLKSKEER